MPDALMDITQMSYEQAFAELEEVVSQLETTQPTLETALLLFQRGQELSKHCSTLLEKAELQVKLLSGDTLIPFSTENQG